MTINFISHNIDFTIRNVKSFHIGHDRLVFRTANPDVLELDANCPIEYWQKYIKEINKDIFNGNQECADYMVTKVTYLSVIDDTIECKKSSRKYPEEFDSLEEWKIDVEMGYIP